MKMKTKKKMETIFEKNKLNICLNFKGMDLIIPDNTNYEGSKYLMISTGNIELRSGSSKK
jgi:hypothetical protein